MIHMWRNPAIMYMCSNLVSFHYTRGALSLYESEVNKFSHKAEQRVRKSAVMITSQVSGLLVIMHLFNKTWLWFSL